MLVFVYCDGKGTDDLLTVWFAWHCPEIMYFFMNIQPVLGKRGQAGRVVSIRIERL
jgi:hypothetical protein